MFGMRTPVSKAKEAYNDRDRSISSEIADRIDLSETEGLSKTFSVRRSIGEIEALNAQTSTTPDVLTVKPATKTAQKSRSPEKLKTARVGMPQKTCGIATLQRSPAKPKYADRLQEAKACVTKTKFHLNSNSAKNISNAIKQDVTQAVERMYALLQESEATKGRTKTKTKEEKTLAIEANEKEADTKDAALDEGAKILEKLEEHTKKLEENNKKIEQLKDIMESMEKASYAAVTASRHLSKLPKHTALHSIIVTSSDGTETSDEVLEKTRKTINAKDGGIQVERVRKAKNGKIVMGFRTEEQRKRVRERIECAGNQLAVEEVKNKDPLLVLRNVISIHTDEEIVALVRSQNQNLFRDLDRTDDRIEVKYRKRARNPHQAHVIVRVSPALWRRALNAGTVSIDIQPIRVEDQSPLVQCSRCLGYGHSKKFCLSSSQIKCSHCGGEHLKAECPAWLSKVEPECCNCLKAQLDNHQHNAFSPECPVRKRWDTLARSTVAYC